MRLISLLVVLSAMCCAASAQGAVSRTGPYFVQSGHFVARPTGVIDLSGTNRFEIGASRWSRWIRASAVARTTYYVNTCKPDCARGPIYEAGGNRPLLPHCALSREGRVYELRRYKSRRPMAARWQFPRSRLPT